MVCCQRSFNMVLTEMFLIDFFLFSTLCPSDELVNHTKSQQSLDKERQDRSPVPTTTTTAAKHRKRKKADVKPSQIEVAENILKMIQSSQPDIKPENFDYFDMFIIIPKFKCLGWYILHWIFSKKKYNRKFFSERQTVERFQSAINQFLDKESFLQDLQTQESSREVEIRVLRNVAGETQNKKFEELQRRISKEDKTLFFIVHDEGNGQHILDKIDIYISRKRLIISLTTFAYIYNSLGRSNFPWFKFDWIFSPLQHAVRQQSCQATK